MEMGMKEEMRRSYKEAWETGGLMYMFIIFIVVMIS